MKIAGAAMSQRILASLTTTQPGSFEISVNSICEQLSSTAVLGPHIAWLIETIVNRTQTANSK
jgi:hypothetical protein